ncbi:MAG: hypothetical protein ACR2JS_07960, partial [Candidatus Nanopelagicales bacterium]
TGSSVPQNQGKGITVWSESWSQWLSNSATGALWTTADPELAVAAAPVPNEASPSATASATPSATASATPSARASTPAA